MPELAWCSHCKDFLGRVRYDKEVECMLCRRVLRGVHPVPVELGLADTPLDKKRERKV